MMVIVIHMVISDGDGDGDGDGDKLRNDCVRWWWSCQYGMRDGSGEVRYESWRQISLSSTYRGIKKGKKG